MKIGTLTSWLIFTREEGKESPSNNGGVLRYAVERWMTPSLAVPIA